jgi:hypothetical protein
LECAISDGTGFHAKRDDISAFVWAFLGTLKNMANEEEWCILCMSFACFGATVIPSNVLHSGRGRTSMMGTTGFVWFTIVYGRCSAGFEEIYHQTTFRQFTALSLVPTSSCDQLIVDHDQSAYTLGNHATIRLILRKATLDLEMRSCLLVTFGVSRVSVVTYGPSISRLTRYGQE